MSYPQLVYYHILVGYLENGCPVYHCIPVEYLGHPGNPNYGGYNTNWGQENLVQLANQLTSQGPSTAGVSAATDGESFQCKWSAVPCGQAHADFDKLMEHLGDIHGVQGPAAQKFVCSWIMSDGRPCGKELRRDGFRRHIGTHVALKMLCTECGRPFSRKDSMSTHRKKEHGWK
ncbi:hypothetical protein HD554DRAFT_1157648 [Boletus coccyginus]|nr:hypothetical protein HD554DRAFT_1157648 [Boletus coccyginus]